MPSLIYTWGLKYTEVKCPAQGHKKSKEGTRSAFEETFCSAQSLSSRLLWLGVTLRKQSFAELEAVSQEWRRTSLEHVFGLGGVLVRVRGSPRQVGESLAPEV